MDKGWSIIREDWEALEQAVPPGEQWNEVLLTLNDQAVVPARPGVYAICAPPPITASLNRGAFFFSLWSPLYIGRSETSIKGRFVKHCRTDDPDLQKAKQCFEKVQLKFWFIELPINAVKDAEARLIKCFGPPVNKRAGTISGTYLPPIEA